NSDNSRRTVAVEETTPKEMVAIDEAGFDWSFMAEEEVPTNMALMAFSDSEYDNLRIEFNKSEFDLATYKRGLASVEEPLVFYKKNEVMFTDQIAVLKRDASFNESELISLKCEIERLNRKGLGYNVVPPPPTGLFAPPCINLSNYGVEEFKQPKFEGYSVKVNKSVCENSSNEIKKTPYALIIEQANQPKIPLIIINLSKLINLGKLVKTPGIT
ncbi:hypothetical protein Tco_1479207, partial [Tanacetum coccineum]